MDIVVNITRILTAVAAPIFAIILASLTALKVKGAQGATPDEGQKCVRCGESRPGAQGEFHYTESIANTREKAGNKPVTSADTPILGSESHFVCDRCAHRYIRNEIIQIVFLVLPYPAYLYVIIPLVAKNGGFANFLIETLLFVLSVAGATSAYDLYRAVRTGRSSLSEARDRVAINARKTTLGKKFSYYTRMGTTQLRK